MANLFELPRYIAIEGPIVRFLIFSAVACHFCCAQAITIRVINAKDGRPLAKQAVSVQFMYDTPPKSSSPLSMGTNALGEAKFDIPQPTPEHLNVRATLSSEHWHCACWVMRGTRQAVRDGIVVDFPITSKAKAPAAPVNAKPGEIIFIARPFTFLERLFYPLVKE